ncbi:MAG: tetratricopeptide repeat protein, partial [Deltaproteobacteria bacterium]|nr:tetratricopeptide repeat protein [Deltaproteobacteria bacterium]
MGKINYLIFLAVFLVGSSLFAQEENSDAKKSFNDGVAAFEDKDFETALKSFEAAYSLNPSWKLLYNIGQCQGALKKYGLAVGSFEKYLSTGGDDIEDGRRNEVLGELEKMRQMIGDIEITGKEGLDVYVDDTLRGTTPLPGAISVSAGIVHKVDLKQDGEIVYSTNKSVRGGKTSKVVYVQKDDADQLEVVMSSANTEPVP